MKTKILNILLILLLSGLSVFTYAQTKEKMVLFETTEGTIKVKLYNETPVHRDNFIKLVESGFFNGVLFHRVINKFMIQAGDPDSKGAEAGKQLGSGGPGYTLPAEIIPHLFHKKGALSAARQGDQANPQRRSSGSQFYIVQGDVYTNETLNTFEQRLYTKFTDVQRSTYTTIGGTPHLDAQYTVFGEVVEGLDIVDKIAAVACDANNRPKTDVKITKATVVTK